MVDVREYIYWSQDKISYFEDYKLILPDISIGNVGQLAVDLLLNNMKVEHLGCIVHPCFLPFLGGDPFDPESKRLETSCEIYECKDQKLVLIQIRTSVFRVHYKSMKQFLLKHLFLSKFDGFYLSKYSEFKNLLLSFIKYFNFKQTIIIASSSSEYFPAEQLQGIPLHYLSTSMFLSNEELKELNWREFSLPNTVVADAQIPGSFVSRDLLEDCEKEKISLIALICICSEGDNYPEAFHVVNCIQLWLKLKQAKDSEEIWKMPVSWELPYGSSAPPEMY